VVELGPHVLGRFATRLAWAFGSIGLIWTDYFMRDEMFSFAQSIQIDVTDDISYICCIVLGETLCKLRDDWRYRHCVGIVSTDHKEVGDNLSQCDSDIHHIIP
jgi:hypothetical protein